VSKVVIDMSMSLDGFVAGPDDGKAHPLGTHGGEHVFDWYSSGEHEVHHPLFRPAPGANTEQVELVFKQAGAYIFGRRTYEIANGWGGAHPIKALPIFVLTHNPPADFGNLKFVTGGIADAIDRARALAGSKDIRLGGASPCKQALAAGLCDEILVHIAPHLMGGGVRLFDALPDGIRLEQLAVSSGPFAAHLRYRVLK
jgi:dihydrofolate reductase